MLSAVLKNSHVCWCLTCVLAKALCYFLRKVGMAFTIGVEVKFKFKFKILYFVILTSDTCRVLTTEKSYVDPTPSH